MSKAKFIGEYIPRAGDWVRVWALVVEPDPHPEEVKVRLESHNEHYLGYIRRDHVEFTGEVPAAADVCTSVFLAESAECKHQPSRGEILVRCQKLHEHHGDHRNMDLDWTDKQEYGHVEENP